jgi:hypothetical protein
LFRTCEGVHHTGDIIVAPYRRRRILIIVRVSFMQAEEMAKLVPYQRSQPGLIANAIGGKDVG